MAVRRLTSLRKFKVTTKRGVVLSQEHSQAERAPVHPIWGQVIMTDSKAPSAALPSRCLGMVEGLLDFDCKLARVLE